MKGIKNLLTSPTKERNIFNKPPTRLEKKESWEKKKETKNPKPKEKPLTQIGNQRGRNSIEGYTERPCT